ncbi:MAG: single-stranded-DNA-specific exonuclease RecJ [Anaerostipes sp.]|nr:single-stranded-DNA-specific exonuclease RecJ [Anaerostipes sp.]
MKEKWVILKKKANFKEIGEKYKIDQVVARILRNREIVGDKNIEEYLYGNISLVSNPTTMKGVKEASELLKRKIQGGEHIRIVSDYDVDGVSSNYILWKSLKELGAKVDYQIPDRMKDGYGINEDMITKAKQDGVDCILTCDNGIAASDAIAYGKELGMEIIVTDHHEVPFEIIEGEKVEKLPKADVIVNPKQENCLYSYPYLCGAGVAFQLMRALYDLMNGDIEIIKNLIPFLGIATVCDVVELTKENRIFVKEALKLIKSTNNLGLRALLDVYELLEKKIASYHFGFVIGPCMNASGRLESAKMVMELFTEKNYDVAKEKALVLKELNETRKEMTGEGVDEALNLVEKEGYKEDSVLIIYMPDCHESIAGIIAGRVKDTYHKPVFVLTRGKDGIKGSGRSIEGYHMFEEMIKIEDVFTKFGGHAMAAGCSLEESRLDEFRRRINDNCILTEDDFTRKVVIDADMPVDYVTFELVEQLSLLEPFGMGNPKPIFAQRKLFINQIRVFGKERNVIRIDFLNEKGNKIQGILFESQEIFNEKKGTHQYMTCTYYPTINEYQGYQNLQITIQNYFFN